MAGLFKNIGEKLDALTESAKGVAEEVVDSVSEKAKAITTEPVYSLRVESNQPIKLTGTKEEICKALELTGMLKKEKQ